MKQLTLLLISLLFSLLPGQNLKALADEREQQPDWASLAETPNQALQTWRHYAGQKPILVLFSNIPFLDAIPPSLRPDVQTLLQHGSDEEVLRRTARISSDPLILHTMTVSAAFEAGIISELVWVIPSTAPGQPLDLEAVRGNLLKTGIIPGQNAAGLQIDDGVIRGTVDGHPFRICSQEKLPEIQQPVLTHFDLSYLVPIYRHEIRESIYRLVYDVLRDYQEKHYKLLSFSISNSNISGMLPLASRFLGLDILTLVRHPEMLGQPLPAAWKKRADAMYIANFFQPEEVFKIYHQLANEHPEDASIQYALFQTARELNQGKAALAFLESAVKLDPVYGLEYLDLAETAMQKGVSTAVPEMINKGVAAQPDNPMLLLRSGNLLLQSGHPAEALVLIERLQKLPWSQVYDSATPEMLKAMAKAAREQQAASTTH